MSEMQGWTHGSTTPDTARMKDVSGGVLRHHHCLVSLFLSIVSHPLATTPVSQQSAAPPSPAENQQNNQAAPSEHQQLSSVPNQGPLRAEASRLGLPFGAAVKYPGGLEDQTYKNRAINEFNTWVAEYECKVSINCYSRTNCLRLVCSNPSQFQPI